MKEFDCADVVPGCGARFRAGSAEELVALGALHAGWAHGMTDQDVTPEVLAAVHASIRDV